ncbi:hypothetical protein EDC01DRAFT_630709 [Geopyxis carbonaria]|nr:hypothetical protein EDC01DRAFT_630709 [Geopyxis carbonaria]
MNLSQQNMNGTPVQKKRQMLTPKGHATRIGFGKLSANDESYTPSKAPKRPAEEQIFRIGSANRKINPGNIVQENYMDVTDYDSAPEIQPDSDWDKDNEDTMRPHFQRVNAHNKDVQDMIEDQDYNGSDQASDVDESNELEFLQEKFGGINKNIANENSTSDNWVQVNASLKVPEKMKDNLQMIINRAGNVSDKKMVDFLMPKHKYDGTRGGNWETTAGIEDGKKALAQLNRGAKLAFARYFWYPDTIITKLISEVSEEIQMPIDIDSSVGNEMWSKMQSWRKNWWQNWVDSIRTSVKVLCNENAGYSLLPDEALVKCYTKHWSVAMLFQHFGVIKDTINGDATCKKQGWERFFKTMWIYSMVIYFPSIWPKEKALKAMKLIAVNEKFKMCKLDGLVLNPIKPIRHLQNKGKPVTDIAELDPDFDAIESDS